MIATHRPDAPTAHPEAVRLLQETGQLFFQRGWSVGTSSNYSVVLDSNPLRLLITASGKDKGRLRPEDFVVVGGNGQPIDPAQPAPSAETLLHVLAAQAFGARAVLHTHSIWATILSDLYFDDGAVEIYGYEMLKGLSGITTHETRVRLPIFENSQDIPALVEQVRARQGDSRVQLQYGFLLRRHGLYTWGRDLAHARRHVEILEFLLETLGRRLSLTAPSR